MEELSSRTGIERGIPSIIVHVILHPPSSTPVLHRSLTINLFYLIYSRVGKVEKSIKIT